MGRKFHGYQPNEAGQHKTPYTAFTITGVGNTKGGRTGNPRLIRRRNKPFGGNRGK